MRTVQIWARKSQKPYKLPNGDVYDSRLILIDGEGNAVFTTDQVNVDPTVGYKGGLLAPGKYKGIMGYRWNAMTNAWNGKRVIKLFSADLNRTDHRNLSDADQILPSAIPNPNHDGRKVIQYAQIHSGGWQGDHSAGCITLLPSEWDKFAAMIADNEVVHVELIYPGA